MQTLVFNTTDKTVKLYEGNKSESKLVAMYDDVPTVKCERGYYEIMRKSLDTTAPVMRVPISNTNMVIEK
jgi:hypothetical protein